MANLPKNVFPPVFSGGNTLKLENLLTEPSLWPFAQQLSHLKPDSGVARLQYGTYFLTSPDLISSLRAVKIDDFVESAAFLRLGETPLPRKDRAAIGKLIAGLARITPDPSRMDIAVCHFADKRFRNRSWGIPFIATYFAESLGANTSKKMKNVVRSYISKSILPDDIEGRLFRPYRAVDAIRGELEECLEERLFESVKNKDNPQNLLDIANNLGERYTVADKAELVQRLILAFVGFTGIALEWSVIMAATTNSQYAVDRASEHVLETLRLYPPSWRSMVSFKKQVNLGSLAIPPSADVLLCAFALQRDARIWSRPDTFSPERWEQSLQQSYRASYRPFGGRPQSCPARDGALNAIIYCTKLLHTQFDVEVFGDPFRHPKVLTLLAPSDSEIIFHSK